MCARLPSDTAMIAIRIHEQADYFKPVPGHSIC